MTLRVLCIGDIFARPGRRAVQRLLPTLIDELQLDLVIANAENAAGGAGLTIATAKELLDLPIAVLTGGNHSWKHKEIIPLMKKEPRILRPYNFPNGTPGHGYTICSTRNASAQVAVINVMGRIFMEPLPNPFELLPPLIAQLQQTTKLILVDVHAEATSEKRALGWFLDGKVSAVFGTHTHVQTADEEILPQGTGYLTDLGMTGPYDSVIGMKKDLIIQRLISMRPTGFEAAEGDVRLCGAVFELDSETGKTVKIERIRRAVIL